MPTSLTYAHTKLHSAALALTTRDEPLRDRLRYAFEQAALHIGPPYDHTVPDHLAAKLEELFDYVAGMPRLDDGGPPVMQGLEVLPDDEAAAIAGTITGLFGEVAEALGKLRA